MMFSVIVKCKRFTKHIRSQCASWIFLQAKLLLRCNRYQAGVRRVSERRGSLICLVNMAVGRLQFLRSALIGVAYEKVPTETFGQGSVFRAASSLLGGRYDYVPKSLNGLQSSAL